MKNFLCCILLLLVLFLSGIQDGYAADTPVVKAVLKWSRKAHRTEVHNVAFSPDAKSFLTGSLTELVVWDSVSYRVRHLLDSDNLKHSLSFDTYPIPFSQNGEYLIVETLDVSRICLWNTQTGKKDLEIKGFPSRSVIPGNLKQLAVAVGKTANIIEVGTGQVKQKTQFPDDIGSLSYAPKENKVFASCRNGTIYISETVDGKIIREVEMPDKSDEMVLYSSVLSPCGKYILTTTLDNCVFPQKANTYLWRVSDGKIVCTMKNYYSTLSLQPFPNDGTSFLTVPFKKNDLYLWNTKTGKMRHILRGHTEILSSVRFSQDGKYLVSGAYDKTARVWDVHSGKELLKLEHSAKVSAVGFSPNAKQLLVGCEDGTVLLYDIIIRVLGVADK